MSRIDKPPVVAPAGGAEVSTELNRAAGTAHNVSPAPVAVLALQWQRPSLSLRDGSNTIQVSLQRNYAASGSAHPVYGQPGEPAFSASPSARIAELEQALKERDEFLSIAAHELRNPMHALLLQVCAAVEAARQLGPQATALMRRLERVQHIVGRYVKRASLLLDVARMNATQRRQLDPESLDFAEVAREVIESYAAEAKFRRSTFEVRVPKSAPGTGDRLAVEQIVSNLISNAIKFGAGGPVTVELSLVTNGAWVQLSVCDRGVGIAEEDHSRIFGCFERLPTPGPRTCGAGLGLWLVRELVAAQGGSISVASSRGGGAKFTVKLPVKAGSRSDSGVDGQPREHIQDRGSAGEQGP